MAENATMLELKNVTKTFNPGTVNEKIAMNRLSLDVKKGDFITVIGGNGAGKSTLMNAVTGVFGVDSGKISLDGIDITSSPYLVHKPTENEVSDNGRNYEQHRPRVYCKHRPESR